MPHFPIGEITSDLLRVVGEARAGSLGPFSPSFNIQNVLFEGMQRYLPHDVHKIVSGKLHISLTRVYDGKNIIVSEFPTREDLLQVCRSYLWIRKPQPVSVGCGCTHTPNCCMYVACTKMRSF